MKIQELFKKVNYREYYDHVIDWNSTPRSGKHEFTQDAIDLQYTFVEEELDELQTALKDNDAVEVVDALCDLFVVSSYWDYLVSHYNKTVTPDLTPWEMLSPLRGIDYLSELNYHVTVTKSPYLVIQSIMVLLNQLDCCAHKAMVEVLRSNDSKFPTKEELSVYFPVNKKNLELECKRIEDTSKGRYNGVTYKKVKNKYVFLSNTGKILKPVTFSEPKLENFV